MWNHFKHIGKILRSMTCKRIINLKLHKVNKVNASRDIIIIESHEEIIQNLMQTKKALEAYANNAWIGISSK